MPQKCWSACLGIGGGGCYGSGVVITLEALRIFALEVLDCLPWKYWSDCSGSFRVFALKVWEYFMWKCWEFPVQFKGIEKGDLVLSCWQVDEPLSMHGTSTHGRAIALSRVPSPPVLRVGVNHIFKSLDSYRSSPESADLWYKSGGSEKMGCLLSNVWWFLLAGRRAAVDARDLDARPRHQPRPIGTELPAGVRSRQTF